MDTTASATGIEVIPYIFYRDVPAALGFLARAFGFTEALREATPGGMHAEMLFGGRRIMMGQRGAARRPERPGATDELAIGIFVYLPAVDAHHARARDAGAEIVQPPHDAPYGRTYTARDLDGHTWYFTTPAS